MTTEARRPRQATLFGPTRDRKPRQWRMHVCDAADGCGVEDSGPPRVRFECPRCNHRTDWVRVANVTEGKRGLPCPVCNAPKGAP